MIPNTVSFIIRYLFLRVFWTCIAFSLIIGSTDASQWQIQISMIDSHLATMGGERYIFLQIYDENNQHIANLSKDNVIFKVNNEPYMFAGFGYQFQQFDQRIAFLVDPELPLVSKNFETILGALNQFILQKEVRDEIFLNFNGSGLKSMPVGSKEKYETFLKELELDSSHKKAGAEFILEQSELFQQRGKRQWLILITSDFASWNESVILEDTINHFLQKYQISFFPIVIGVAPQWLERLVSERRSEIYRLDTMAQLPSVLQKIQKKISQEYLLTYQLKTLGSIPHDIEIKFIGKHGVESIHHHADYVSIWPHTQKPMPLSGLVGIGGIFLIGIGRLLFKNRKSVVLSKQTGFQIMTPGENFQFIPLNQSSYVLDFLSTIRTKRNLRLSANLDKVLLTAEQNSYFLEDKNYKNALLINRRRVKRYLLRHGDVLDIGEMTLIFLNQTNYINKDVELDEQVPIPIYFDKPLGPIRKKVGTLINMTTRQEYYLVKNITFFGRSKTNNVVLNSSQIALRHAKIIRIGTQYKLVSLSNQEGTFVNRRRVEQRFLKEGDEISFENCLFRFRMLNHASTRGDKAKSSVQHA